MSTTFNPYGPVTLRAWTAITKYLNELAYLGLGARRPAVLALAVSRGLGRDQANRFLDEAITHGHLEQNTVDERLRLGAKLVARP